MKIGLVTVLYKSAPFLERFIDCLESQDQTDIFTFFINNASPDDSAAIVTNRLGTSSSRHEIIQAGANLGVAEGNNIGIRKSIEKGCEWVLLLNNDIEFPSNAISRLVEAAKSKRAALTTPLILFHGTDKIWMAGGRLTFTGAGLHFGEGKSLADFRVTAAWVPYAPTCFMLIHCDVFSKIGIMDPKYFVYSDDADFLFRASKAGFRIFLDADVTISHKVSGSTGGASSPFAIKFGNRNRLYFLRKHFRGIGRMARILYFLATRSAYFLSFGDERRKILVSAIKEGFTMPLPDREAGCA
jgi:GT2 family glycosyltransferase